MLILSSGQGALSIEALPIQIAAAHRGGSRILLVGALDVVVPARWGNVFPTLCDFCRGTTKPMRSWWLFSCIKTWPHSNVIQSLGGNAAHNPCPQPSSRSPSAFSKAPTLRRSRARPSIPWPGPAGPGQRDVQAVSRGWDGRGHALQVSLSNIIPLCTDIRIIHVDA